MTKEVSFQNTNLSYSVQGEGNAVVLLHGFGEDRHIWNSMLPFLASGYKYIIPDLPGSGDSGLLQEGSMEIYAEAVHHLLQQENIATATIIGHSMGGYITLAYAEKFPEQLAAFGLFHSSAYADDEEKKNTRRKAIEFIQQNGAAAFLRTSIPNLFSEAFRKEYPAQVEALVKAGERFSAEALIQFYEAMIQRPDRTTVFNNFNKPVLFIIGDKDPAVPFNLSLKQCHLPAISDVHILRCVAHMGMVEKPELCAAYINNFLKGLA